MNYVQCALVNGNSHLVSWIPEKFAELFKVLKLKNNGEWEDGWKVISTGTVLDEKLVPDSHQEIKSLWRATSGNNPIGHK